MAHYINRWIAGLSFAAAAFGLAACSDNLFNSGFDPFGNKTSQNAPALEGRWVDANGIPSTFRGGVFETRSPDTNEKLSEGNYVFGANNIVTLEMRSLVRGTVSHVNCSLSGAKLYCTTENNTKFVLSRG